LARNAEFEVYAARAVAANRCIACFSRKLPFFVGRAVPLLRQAGLRQA